MKSGIIVLAILALLVLAPAVNAQLVYYNSRAAFEAAVPGLSVEDFEEARGIGTMTGDLDKYTDNAYFIPGEILDGLRISSGSDELSIAKVVGNYWYGDTLSLIFYNNNVNAVGMEILEWPIGQEITIEIFGTGGLLDSFDFGSGSGFWGVTSTEIITEIRLSDFWAYPLTVDDISFIVPRIPDISGCAEIKGEPMAGRKVLLRQFHGIPDQVTTTDADGCYEFLDAVPGAPSTVIIRGPLIP